LSFPATGNLHPVLEFFMIKVLIVDDEAKQRNILSDILAAQGGISVFEAASFIEAINCVKQRQPAVVVTDLKMAGKTGLDLIEEINQLPLPPEVIVATAFGSIETAIKATRLGAYDYLTKPIKPEELLFLIGKANEKYLLKKESLDLKQTLTAAVGSELIAQSLVMRRVYNQIEKVAETDSTVLIRGETGTGKECVARLIHFRSIRAAKPMKCINCAAVNETLLDSELFGYEKGAFTGAQTRKIGVIEAASGGTLFLDEVADMSPNTQAKVLRMLQQREIRRVGGTEDIKIDVRIIAATNKNLEDAIRSGTFREDLFYRLNIVPICVPPLRERREDIPLLIEHFFSRLGQPKEIDSEAMQLLLEHDWPGNVRELEALIERITVFSENQMITIEDLPVEITKKAAKVSVTIWDLPEHGIVLEELERQLISNALERSHGNMAAAAKLLGLSYRAFRYRANSYGLREI
jgi:DNA-binding NtrC family response regulator